MSTNLAVACLAIVFLFKLEGVRGIISVQPKILYLCWSEYRQLVVKVLNGLVKCTFQATTLLFAHGIKHSIFLLHIYPLRTTTKNKWATSWDTVSSGDLTIVDTKQSTYIITKSFKQFGGLKFCSIRHWKIKMLIRLCRYAGWFEA